MPTLVDFLLLQANKVLQQGVQSDIELLPELFAILGRVSPAVALRITTSQLLDLAKLVMTMLELPFGVGPVPISEAALACHRIVLLQAPHRHAKAFFAAAGALACAALHALTPQLWLLDMPFSSKDDPKVASTREASQQLRTDAVDILQSLSLHLLDVHPSLLASRADKESAFGPAALAFSKGVGDALAMELQGTPTGSIPLVDRIREAVEHPSAAFYGPLVDTLRWTITLVTPKLRAAVQTSATAAADPTWRCIKSLALPLFRALRSATPKELTVSLVASAAELAMSFGKLQMQLEGVTTWSDQETLPWLCVVERAFYNLPKKWQQLLEEHRRAGGVGESPMTSRMVQRNIDLMTDYHQLVASFCQAVQSSPAVPPLHVWTSVILRPLLTLVSDAGPPKAGAGLPSVEHARKLVAATAELKRLRPDCHCVLLLLARTLSTVGSAALRSLVTATTAVSAPGQLAAASMVRAVQQLFVQVIDALPFDEGTSGPAEEALDLLADLLASCAQYHGLHPYVQTAANAMVTALQGLLSSSLARTALRWPLQRLIAQLDALQPAATAAVRSLRKAAAELLESATFLGGDAHEGVEDLIAFVAPWADVQLRALLRRQDNQRSIHMCEQMGPACFLVDALLLPLSRISS